MKINPIITMDDDNCNRIAISLEDAVDVYIDDEFQGFERIPNSNEKRECHRYYVNVKYRTRHKNPFRKRYEVIEYGRYHDKKYAVKIAKALLDIIKRGCQDE